MRVDTICTDQFAYCPSCDAPMRLARSFSSSEVPASSQTFECKQCRFAVAAESLEMSEMAG